MCHGLQVENVATDDWVDSIKASYRPVQIVPAMWVVPVWSEAPDPCAVNIVVEPGLAFGTGDHSTTRMCLQWLHSFAQSLKGARVMDYGTGMRIILTSIHVGIGDRACLWTMLVNVRATVT